MRSPHVGRTFIWPSTDGGLYYARQLDASDGISGFEGIVWIGEHISADPAFTNVYFGRADFSGYDLDDAGQAIHRWSGRFTDVPKGRSCGTGDLQVRTFWAPASASVGADFPEPYLIQEPGVASSFGATTWPIDFGLSGSWAAGYREGRVSIAPPALNPDLETVSGVAIRNATEYAATAMMAAYEGTGLADLTGTWIGDDGGTYYLDENRETHEVVWFAEHHSTRAAVPPIGIPGVTPSPATPAAGWATVFAGHRVGEAVTGIYADVPKGARFAAGGLSATVVAADRLEVRPEGLPEMQLTRHRDARHVLVSIPQLTIPDRNESSDDPTLYISFCKLDADSVALGNATDGHALFKQHQVHLGTNVGAGPVAIPPAMGTYSTMVSPLREPDGTRSSEPALVGVSVYAVERDDGQGSFRDYRFERWASSQRDAFATALHSGHTRTAADARQNENAVLTRFSWSDTDDLLGGDGVVLTYDELERAAGAQVFHLVFSRDGTYAVDVTIESTSRSVAGCR